MYKNYNDMLSKANRLVDIEQRMDVIRHLTFMLKNSVHLVYGIMVEEYRPSPEEIGKQKRELEEEFDKLKEERRELITSMYNEVKGA